MVQRDMGGDDRSKALMMRIFKRSRYDNAAGYEQQTRADDDRRWHSAQRERQNNDGGEDGDDG